MTEFYKMTAEEREQINSKIYSMIGTQHDAMSEYKGMSERMMASKTWKKEYEALVKIAEKYGIEKLTETVILKCNEASGKTASGKKYYYVMNNGMEIRSRYCGTLYIDGKCKFTSGRIGKVIEYIINN